MKHSPPLPSFFPSSAFYSSRPAALEMLQLKLYRNYIRKMKEPLLFCAVSFSKRPIVSCYSYAANNPNTAKWF